MPSKKDTGQKGLSGSNQRGLLQGPVLPQLHYNGSHPRQPSFQPGSRREQSPCKILHLKISVTAVGLTKETVWVAGKYTEEELGTRTLSSCSTAG